MGLSMGRLGDTIDYLTTVGVVTEPLLAGYAAYSPFDDGLRVFFVLLDFTLLLFGQSWDSTSFACFAHFSFAYIFRVDLYSRILPFAFVHKMRLLTLYSSWIATTTTRIPGVTAKKTWIPGVNPVHAQRREKNTPEW